jgi:(p)ppGpp synthase/HD superfamily hydrolase
MEEKALEFAREAHGKQLRKYGEEPYIEHPIRVAKLVRTVPHTSEMICAAYLHDVVEDTPVSIRDINRKFGEKVALLVDELTDEYVKEKYPHLNRRKRKEREVVRQAKISKAAKTIKLADVIDNTRDIIQNDLGFARRYIPEMAALTEALQGGNFRLFLKACYEVQRGLYVLKQDREDLTRKKN